MLPRYFKSRDLSRGWKVHCSVNCSMVHPAVVVLSRSIGALAHDSSEAYSYPLSCLHSCLAAKDQQYSFSIITLAFRDLTESF